MLNTEPNFHDGANPPRHAYDAGDAFYELLIETHGGLADADSRLLNARLVLLLANHIGDLTVLRQALDAARAGLLPEPIEGDPR